jgi:molybdopterin synthase sulfur carrier subunit
LPLSRHDYRRALPARNYTPIGVFTLDVMRVDAQTASLAGIPLQSYNSPVPTARKTIRVKVLFFGRLREIVGCAEDFFELSDGASIEVLFTGYSARHPELVEYRSSVVAARNQQFAAWNSALHTEDEVAFLPPVSGG